MLKKLFYASASILMLALAYHLGATNATAQAPGNSVVCPVTPNGYAPTGGGFEQAVATANGDIYACVTLQNGWYHVGNIFTGPTAVQQATWGELKARYRK